MIFFCQCLCDQQRATLWMSSGETVLSMLYLSIYVQYKAKTYNTEQQQSWHEMKCSEEIMEILYNK